MFIMCGVQQVEMSATVNFIWRFLCEREAPWDGSVGNPSSMQKIEPPGIPVCV